MTSKQRSTMYMMRSRSLDMLIMQVCCQVSLSSQDIRAEHIKLDIQI